MWWFGRWVCASDLASRLSCNRPGKTRIVMPLGIRLHNNVNQKIAAASGDIPIII
jgi:hypothetical protein